MKERTLIFYLFFHCINHVSEFHLNKILCAVGVLSDQLNIQHIDNIAERFID